MIKCILVCGDVLMPKKNALCVLCGARKNLNYANLCKRCNKTTHAAAIKAKVLGEKNVAQAMKSKRLAEEAAAKKASAAEEAPAEEEKAEASAEESEEKKE